MSNFKSGDKVVCIESIDSYRFITSWSLIKGKEYIVNKTITHGNDNFISIHGVGTDDTEFRSLRFELVKESEFDITADISRQFTRDDREVVLIVDSGLDIDYPLSVYFKGYNYAMSYSREGKWKSSDSQYSDLVTRPPLKPNNFSYIAVRATNGDFIHSYTTKPNSWSLEFVVFKVTYNPNTKEMTTELIIN